VTIFEYILSDDVVEDAVTATLRRWMGTEMAEVERQRGLTEGHYGRPRSYVTHTDFESFPEEQLPCIIVVSLGFGDEPKKEGSGSYRHFYNVGVAAIASSSNQDSSRRYAYRVGAAVAGCLVHNQSLDQGIGGRVQAIDLMEKRNGEIPPDGDRTLWIVRQVFRIEVRDALTKSAGPVFPDEPKDPDTIPWPNWPSVGEGQVSINTEITKEPIDDQ
jgi:hypothetical protein